MIFILFFDTNITHQSVDYKKNAFLLFMHIFYSNKTFYYTMNETIISSDRSRGKEKAAYWAAFSSLKAKTIFVLIMLTCFIG